MSTYCRFLITTETGNSLIVERKHIGLLLGVFQHGRVGWPVFTKHFTIFNMSISD
jgi:hypothetical protein